MKTVFESTRLKVKQALADGSVYENEPLLERICEILTPSVVENLPPYFHNIHSKAQAQQWLKQMLTESRLFVVELRSSEVIGFVFAYVESNDDVHIGYLLAEECWGQGFASELLSAFIEHSTQNESWNKLIGGVDPQNVASARLLKKLGFVERLEEGNEAIFFEYHFANTSA
ncbi:GNAT family N-acetyltransferase [Vibrio tapetis]|uniref:GCN5-like N-acetyltransferase n=1 Tax=Vibrio tapetis subsp. tapetis TaxID=1671868 RepID=A0A2N8ZM31_9VIBR|nr:GNAT family N-acetyltransferase [Vibrio tapetis]SON52960.1 GCN5-like N-acetyltransferase [Vibrio tapetis subsp. tapetis]